MNNEETLQLVKLARLGDCSAQEQLFNQYKPVVRAICHGLFLLGGEQEDLMQEGFIALFAALNNYDEGKGTFSAFASLCIKRRIYSCISKANTLSNKQLFNAAPLSDAEQYIEDGFGRIEDDELLVAIRQFIAEKLTAVERRVTELYTEGYTHEQICTITGRSYKSVDSALQRARKKFMELRGQL